MQAIVEPGFISGSITIPASKSMMQRVCAAALLHRGKTTVLNCGTSKDDKAALNIIQQLGAQVAYLPDGDIVITGNGLQPQSNIIHCGESGLSARMFLPIAALSNEALTITGSGSLLNRPMQTIVDVLPKLGVLVESNNNKLPVKIQGPLKTDATMLDGNESSQYLTGLLFAYAFSSQQPVTITVENLKSRPYIDMTLEVLADFGKKVVHDNYHVFHIQPTGNLQQDIIYEVEADWSSAAFWLAAGAISGNIALQRLHLSSHQADKAILDVLKQTGAQVSISGEDITVSKTKKLLPFCFDATHSPDLFPVLAVLAAYCNGKSAIKGIHRLTHKESDRTESISAMLQAFEVNFEIEDDELTIHGAGKIAGGHISSFNDHRIAMAAAVAALGALSPVTIDDAGAIAKSYPNFFTHQSQLGGRVTIK